MNINNSNSSIILGSGTSTEEIKGQTKYKTAYYAFTTQPNTINLTWPLPEIIFIDQTVVSDVITMNLPAITPEYQGARLQIRKTYNAGGALTLPTDINIYINGGGKFVDYNSLVLITACDFNTGYVYIDFICDGTYWCINNIV